MDAASYLPGANALIGAITAEDLKHTLMAGYTSVRELEGYAGDLVPGIDGGYIIGPNVYSSHAALSMTGGHGDEHWAPIATVVEAMNRGGFPIGICDGVPECIKTVRLMIRRGARVIKVCASGGVLSLNDNPEDRQFSDEELRAIVQEAARSRRAVAAHAIGKAGIMAALHAGVKSIEHGIFLDEEVAELMKEKGAYFVATQHIIRTLNDDYLDKLPPQSRAKAGDLVERSKTAYKTAVRSGVKIALGTDMLSSNRNSRLSHGNNAHELVWAVEAGMTPLQAIECATANGPETLGGMAPLSGQLKEGYDADFIAVSTSPLEDVSVLTNTSNITHVWKGGKLFKEP
jgi:imidazolonepropionase-like amidohydrolase